MESIHDLTAGDGWRENNSLSATSTPEGDYVSPGLEMVILDRLFPHMIVGDKVNHPWTHLRREVPHNWYCDSRFPAIGFLNRDEAIILYNIALGFRGKSALEIGSWMGWSTLHLALAGAEVDAIDPIFAKKENRASLEDALRASGLSERVSVSTEASPDAVHRLAAERGKKWDLFFIDGDHDSPHPELDATACLEHAAEDAMFVFHDLASPDVEKGLAVLRRAGFNTLIYQTMQIMGVAWRGNCTPVAHRPDPRVSWSIPSHLRKYRISGEGPDLPASVLVNRVDGLEEEIQETAAQARLVAREHEQGLSAARAKIEDIAAQARLAAREQEQELSRARAQIKGLGERIEQFQDSSREQEREVAQAKERAAGLQAQINNLRKVIAANGQELGRWRADMSRLRGIADNLRSELDEARKALLDAPATNDTERLLPAATVPSREPDGRTTKITQKPQIPQPSSKLGRAAEVATTNSSRGGRIGNAIGVFSALTPALARLLATGKLRSAQHLVRDWKRLSKSHLFDEEFYKKHNPDALEGRADVHYLLHAREEGRDPNPLFATGWYLRENPDIAKADVNPLLHYLRRGAAERRDPSPLFATSWYLAANPDIAKAGVNPLVHYLKNGWREGRDPHPRFDTAFYLEQHPECGERNPLLDFLERNPRPDLGPGTATWSMPEEGICIVTPDILGPVKNGGIGTACYHFAVALAQSGRQVTILFAGSLNEPRRLHWRKHYAELSITFLCMDDTPPIERHTWGGTWFLDISWRIFSFLRSRRFECVHFQDWQANGFWSIRAKKIGLAFENTTLTVTMHSCSKWIAEGMALFPPKPVEHTKLVWCETTCMQDCDILLSPSQHMFEWATRNDIALPADHRTMPYVMPQREEVEVGRKIDNSHLIFFGRLETRKGLHIFADALRRLAKEGDAPSKVTFLGKHAEVEGTNSQDYIANLQADLPQVSFNTITNLDTFQAQAYVRDSGGLVVIPSILDNYPLVILECLLNGLPFFAAATGGIVEMVDPAVLFQPNGQDLARILRSRDRIDHGALRHQYDRTAARVRWLDFHDDLRAAIQPLGSTGAELPFVSVCIPFYRHGQFLRKLVESFASQDYPTFEVVLVNDGSGPEFSEEFEETKRQSKDSRFRLISTENSGPGSARNTAARHATGQVLVFFDADNLPRDDRFLTKAVTALLHAKVDCVTIPYDIIDHEVMDPAQANVKATFRPIGSCVQVAFVENVLGDATLAIRREAFESVGGFPVHRDTNWEDWEFLVQFALSGKRMISHPDALYFYRDDPKGRNRSARRYQCHRSRMNRYLVDHGNCSWQVMRDIALPLALREYGER